jgi:concanavalin A-like lectin/glucanase superfamily protein
MTTLSRLRLGVAAVTLALIGAGFAAPADATTYDFAGLWLLNEGSGQAAHDLSFSGNPGQLGSTTAADANDPAWVQLPRLLLLKRAALRFDGDDYVSVRDAPSLEPDGVTVVARVRATGSPGAYRYVVSKGALACETASYGLYTGAGGGLTFYVSDGSHYVLSPDAGPALWDGAWHTVVGAYNGSQVRLWVDGRIVGSAPADFPIGYGLPDADRFYIGTYGGPCGTALGFVGDIDGVALIGSYAGPGAGGLVD